MKYYRMFLSGALLSALAAGCTATGGLANKTAPVDWKVTLSRVCTGLAGLDAVYKSVAPPLVAAGKMQQVWIADEAAAFKLLNNACDPAHPPTDLPGAVALVAIASVDLGNLVGVLSK